MPDLMAPALDAAATRRDFLAVLAAAGLLGACATAPTTTGAATRTVTHARGTTEVPLAPSRLFVVDPYVLDCVVALGVVPAGAMPMYQPTPGEPGPFPSWLDLVGPEPVGEYGRIEPEVVARFAPDMVIGGDGFIGESYAVLSRIAPTVAVTGGQDWRGTTLPAVAAALGRQDALAPALAPYERRSGEVRAVLAPAGLRVHSISTFPDTLYVDAPDHWTSRVMGDVGVTALPRGNDDGVLSPELLGSLDGDAIFVRVQDEGRLAQLEADPLWRRLPAVRSGRVHLLRKATWAFPGPAAALEVLDDLAGALA